MKQSLGILFDMDGVLLDSESATALAGAEAFHRLGIPAQPEDFRAFTGMGERDYFGGVAEKYGASFRTEMKDLAYAIYGDIANGAVHLYPAVLPTLQALKQAGYPMALASSADEVKVLINLRAAGIDPALFDALLCGNDVARKKPFPDLYLEAAKRLGLSPRSCVVIEDALVGIEAGRAAGAFAIVGVTSTFDPKTLQNAGAAYVIDDLGALPEVIHTIQQSFEEERQ